MVHFLNTDDTIKALSIGPLMDALDEAFKSGLTAPRRHHHTIKTIDDDGNTGNDATLLLMPCWDGTSGLGAKMVTVFPDNMDKGLPTVQGLYILMNGQTGEPKAILDGQSLTVIRTAATSALAARYLAKKNCKSMLMVGTGSLAPHMIRAHVQAKKLEEIMIWGRNSEKAKDLAKTLCDEGLNVMAVDNLEAATGKADIITTATLSTIPLIKGDWVRPGTHIDLVGAYTPKMRESDDALIKKAKVFVDTFDGALAEGGDITQPLKDGIISRADILADLYDLAQGKHAGRSNDDEITVFKSVGCAIEDFVAATVAVEAFNIKK
jgi:ornithine cyclodeaminase